jgi:hypothetical protein
VLVNLHPLFPIGHALRVGRTGRQLKRLLGAGQCSINSFVVDAGLVERQGDLVTRLRESGSELILDTHVAELSSLARFQTTAAQKAPWARQKPLQERDFRDTPRAPGVLRQVAQFAVRNGFSAVLSPSRFLAHGADATLAFDRAACIEFRELLNAEGGRKITIDYNLLVPNTVFRSGAERRALVAALRDLPIDNIWIRLSPFGSDATATGIERYASRMVDLHVLGRPIIADQLAGFAALAPIAFGAVSGFAHGVAEEERFDASAWDKPKRNGRPSFPKRLLFPELDRSLTERQVDELMKLTVARRHLSCRSEGCCPNGLSDTKRDSKRHYLHQRASQVARLERVPVQQRIEHFLKHELEPAVRRAAHTRTLPVRDDGLKQALARTHERLEKMPDVLGRLAELSKASSRAAAVVVRGRRGRDASGFR